MVRRLVVRLPSRPCCRRVLASVSEAYRRCRGRRVQVAPRTVSRTGQMIGQARYREKSSTIRGVFMRTTKWITIWYTCWALRYNLGDGSSDRSERIRRPVLVYRTTVPPSGNQ